VQVIGHGASALLADFGRLVGATTLIERTCL